MAIMPPENDPSEIDTSAESAPSQTIDAPLPDPDDESTDAFYDLVFAALDSLPQAFRDRLGRVAIVVEDEPTPDQLRSLGASGLLGLYTGVPRTAWGADGAAVASKITIFRGPHLRQFRDPNSLARGVADTVRHEVAHHFGISDARLEELARERRDR
jgi:predicted Zn-dependent protease with MMP-like domain